MNLFRRAAEAVSWRWRRLLERLPEPAFTRPATNALFEWMNRNAPGKRVLNLGAGVGRFDGRLSPAVRAIRLDIDPTKPGLDCVGDAERLPVRDASVDIVYSVAVLEHVRKPWLAAAEIARVLRPGGYVALELPFLNVIHDRHDYFRFTDLGIRSLFDKDAFDVVLARVGSFGGSFLSVFLAVYPLQFLPTEFLRATWYRLAGYPLSLLRFLDVLNPSPGAARTKPDGFRIGEGRISANSFTFIAQKR